jgi:hypothetical protein
VRRGTYKPEGGVSDSRRLEYARAVKSTDFVWTWMSALNKKYMAAEGMEAKMENMLMYEVYLDKFGSGF